MDTLQRFKWLESLVVILWGLDTSSSALLQMDSYPCKVHMSWRWILRER